MAMQKAENRQLPRRHKFLALWSLGENMVSRKSSPFWCMTRALRHWREIRFQPLWKHSGRKDSPSACWNRHRNKKAEGGLSGRLFFLPHSMVLIHSCMVRAPVFSSCSSASKSSFSFWGPSCSQLPRTTARSLFAQRGKVCATLVNERNYCEESTVAKNTYYRAF